MNKILSTINMDGFCRFSSPKTSFFYIESRKFPSIIYLEQNLKGVFHLKRIYRYEGTHYRDVLKKISETKEPVIVFHLETTGLDPKVDEIIQIGAVKCEMIEGEIIPINIFSTFVKPTRAIPERVTNLTDITDDVVKNAPSLKDAMAMAVEFFGTRPTVIGYNCKNFALPFLKRAGFDTGEMIYPSTVLDILDIVRSVISKNEKIQSYSCRAVANYLGCENDPSYHDAKLDSEKYIRILRKLLPMIPEGSEMVNIESVKYWEKSRNTRFLYVITDRGKVSINAVNGFWAEEVPGFFNEVDMDQLTEYMLEKKKVSSIWDLISLYETSHE